MKVIVTKQNDDGTYNEVGMNTRMLINWLKADYAILKHARQFANGKPFRLEYFHDTTLYGVPFKVVHTK